MQDSQELIVDCGQGFIIYDVDVCPIFPLEYGLFPAFDSDPLDLVVFRLEETVEMGSSSQSSLE